MTTEYKKPVCSHCGSDDVVADACARWNIETQCWVMSDTHEHTDCMECEGESRLKWVDIPPPIERRHYVLWEIDLDAKSPLEAAQKALAIQRNPDSIATVFRVWDGLDKEAPNSHDGAYEIDLSKQCNQSGGASEAS